RFVILVFNFCFRWVDVDVDFGRVYLDKQYIQWISICRKYILVGIHHRVMEIGVLDKAFVDKEKLFTAGFLRKFRFANKSVNRNNRGVFLYGHKALIIIVSEEMHDALFQGLRWQMKE